MHTDSWRALTHDRPGDGQRCVVWDTRHRRPVFAYYHVSDPDLWEHQGYFYEMWNGVERPVVAVWWQPEPAPPTVGMPQGLLA